MGKRVPINVRITEAEAAILARHAKDTDQTKSTIMRALIRSLERKKPGK